MLNLAQSSLTLFWGRGGYLCKGNDKRQLSQKKMEKAAYAWVVATVDGREVCLGP